MIDDSREEHRMIIFGNDSDSVQEHLIRGDGLAREIPAQNGILERKIHAESYTVTLYALLRDYGLIPVLRIKPRIRFHRSNYDNLSSSAPLRYTVNDIVHFAELKQGTELTKSVDNTLQERVFGDASTIEDLSEDPALQLVSQRDLFLRQPPFKTKTKIFGQGFGIEGIPIGKFLDALNHPSQTAAIFKPFPSGDEFARDLSETLESFNHLEFQFEVYSRYERRDCVLAGAVSRAADGYRTTFDPWTVLGYIRSDGDTQQFQLLAHERGTRWEHKIMVEDMAPQTLALISQEIRALRRGSLIGRVLSKSQTGLTLLADTRESRLNLTNDLFVGYDLKVAVPLPNDRFADIEYRRKLRWVLSANGQYQLHPFNEDIVERHLNLAKGIKNGVVYTVDNVYLMQGPSPQRVKDDGLIVIREPIHEKVVIRSAQDLRDRMPASGFEKCWNETIDEGGYTVVNQKTGRCYTVSYGKRETGNILDGAVTRQDPEYYLSVKYLGITPDRYAEKTKDVTVPALFDGLAQKEKEIIREVKDLTVDLRDKRLV